MSRYLLVSTLALLGAVIAAPTEAEDKAKQIVQSWKASAVSSSIAPSNARDGKDKCMCRDCMTTDSECCILHDNEQQTGAQCTPCTCPMDQSDCLPISDLLDGLTDNLDFPYEAYMGEYLCSEPEFCICVKGSTNGVIDPGNTDCYEGPACCPNLGDLGKDLNPCPGCCSGTRGTIVCDDDTDSDDLDSSASD